MPMPNSHTYQTIIFIIITVNIIIITLSIIIIINIII